MIDVKIRLIYIDVSGQTPCYRGDVPEIFDELKDDYKDFCYLLVYLNCIKVNLVIKIWDCYTCNVRGTQSI